MRCEDIDIKIVKEVSEFSIDVGWLVHALCCFLHFEAAVNSFSLLEPFWCQFYLLFIFVRFIWGQLLSHSPNQPFLPTTQHVWYLSHINWVRIGRTGATLSGNIDGSTASMVCNAFFSILLDLCSEPRCQCSRGWRPGSPSCITVFKIASGLS